MNISIYTPETNLFLWIFHHQHKGRRWNFLVLRLDLDHLLLEGLISEGASLISVGAFHSTFCWFVDRILNSSLTFTTAIAFHGYHWTGNFAVHVLKTSSTSFTKPEIKIGKSGKVKYQNGKGNLCIFSETLVCVCLSVLLKMFQLRWSMSNWGPAKCWHGSKHSVGPTRVCSVLL